MIYVVTFYLGQVVTGERNGKYLNLDVGGEDAEVFLDSQQEKDRWVGGIFLTRSTDTRDAMARKARILFAEMQMML
ncbi:hypothetical protein HOI18_01295 [Candidatus Uhrbacteria bacterium]|jgi:hypothetical protein|nr:hypothetical protein [Candidatus Uhrbacteria bacterium]